ncbi:SDR family NAD(P)-dependent oxidoreductase [Actinosynnema mirum]|uniref:Acyl transferase n=1 Tax=Actinosynnema mirum (strain ATCC 29888 / DSM 43827 / JCM 3225 / NBRC 14064 / NCIMB 13271 / NRRL B-12336 / IMRU 3971 / 101) TaxID=446462 RepID=C6WJZ7_ACTMD|nr:SDR family NAD(P)-dependent oxidoreductase [Actinosynnema mirum]ACU38210.1 Acyl transferase [Actinosynnema mirum DSM 43827]
MADRAEPALVPWVVSGSAPLTLRANAVALQAHLVGDRHWTPGGVGRSLAARPAEAHRAVLLCRDPADFLTALTELASGAPSARVLTAAPSTGPGPVLVFPGQGPQWPGMAALADAEPVFRAALVDCCAAFAPFLHRPLPSVLDERIELEAPDLVQPALFAVMVALAALWRSRGVEPSAVLGHSAGEFAAAHVAGALPLPEAARALALWSRAQTELVGRGEMIAAALPADEVRALLPRWAGALDLAATNSPRSTVVAGDRAAALDFLAHCRESGVPARRLAVGLGAHSAHVDALRERLLTDLAPIRPRETEIPLHASSTGGLVDGRALDAAHWYANLRGEVRFATATRALLDDGHRVFLEVGPHPVLGPAVLETAHDAGVPDVAALATLRRGGEGEEDFLTALAEAHVRGADVDWTPVFAADHPAHLPEPARSRHAAEPDTTEPDTAEDAAEPEITEHETAEHETAEQQVDGRQTGGRQTGGPSGWTPEVDTPETLAPQPIRDGERDLRDLVRVHLTALLPAGSPPPTDTTSFWELGLDSGAAIRFRDRITAATGVPLPATLLFDHPTPADVVTALVAATTPPPQAAEDDPVAVVAVAGRFPGGLHPGAPLATPEPASTAFDPTAFDPAPFGLTPHEAESLDPRQRHLLETTWEVFERACLPPLSQGGRRVGVFTRAALPTTADLVTTTFGLHDGPSTTVDPTRSSPLTALRLAVRALRSGDCALALAAGETERDGGSGGVAALLLERLADARRNGHPVLALVRGTVADQPDSPAASDLVDVVELVLALRTAAPRQAAPGSRSADDHVVLEPAPTPAAAHHAPVELDPVPWLLSGATAEALRDQARRLAAFATGGMSTVDVGRSLATTREALPHRAVVLGGDDLVRGLDLLADGITLDRVITGRARDRRVVFAFPDRDDRDDRWTGAAEELLRDSEVFRAAIAECDEALLPHTGWSPSAVLRGDPDAPPQHRDAVPTLFAVAVGLAALWRAHGVEPDAVVGQGGGRIAAAHVAGALTLAEAAEIAARTDQADDLILPRPAPIPFHPTTSLDRATLALLATGHDLFVEISPHPVLAEAVTDALTGTGAAVVAAFPRGHGGTAGLVRRLAEAHVLGARVDWAPVFGAGPLVDLPTYAFQHEPAPQPAVPEAVPAPHTTTRTGDLSPEPEDEETPAAQALPAADPIAVIATACRLPGGIRTPDQLRQAIDRADPPITTPTDRGWTDAPGAYLDRVTLFDADFFGLTPDEALTTLPGHRLLLETACEALERAGITPTSSRGARTGVFTDTPDQATRVSEVLGLRGPTTTGATDHPALHQAIHALRAGECELALVGSATVLSDPPPAGATPTEHVVVLLLEPLSAARRHDHPVRGTTDTTTTTTTDLLDALKSVLSQPATEWPPTRSRSGAVVPWPLSAAEPAALRARARDLLDLLDRTPDVDPVDVGFTLATGRATLPHRAVLVAATPDRFRAELSALAGRATDAPATPRSPVFTFPGHPARHLTPVDDLLADSPVFRDRIADCERALAPHVDWSLTAVLRGDPGAPPPERTDVAQPAQFAVAVALAEVWRAHGVEPAAAVGHGPGEIAAAHVAGALSLADAARVVAVRSRLLHEHLAGTGGVVAVSADPEDVVEALGELEIASVDGPGALTVAGAPAALEAFLVRCADRGWRAKWLPVDHAPHSAHVDPLRELLRAELHGLRPLPGRIPLWSPSTGGELDPTRLGPDHWADSLRLPVRFDPTTRALLDAGHDLFVEVAPHPVLSYPLQLTASHHGRPAHVVGALRRDGDGRERLLAALGEAHALGADVRWERAFTGLDPRRADLPTYPFQGRRHWPADREARSAPTYRVDWREREPGPARPSGRWLVAAPGESVLAEALRDRFTALGAEVVRFDPDAPHHLAGPRDLAGVIAVPPAGLGWTLALVRRLAEAGITAPLWCCTRTAAPLGPQDPARATTWGFGQVAAQELGERWGGLIDLPPVAGTREFDLLAGLLTGATGEDRCAIRGGRVLVPRLVPAEPLAPLDFRPERGTVLVTGAFDPVGGHVARWLARSGVEHLLLVGDPYRGDAAALVTELTAMGARVTTADCDLADREALRALLASVPEHTPLTGLVHAAPVRGGAPVDALDPARVAEAVDAGFGAALALHELVGDLPLFVLVSSLDGTVGAPGRAAGAAVGAGLDALARHRASLGLTATAITWEGDPEPVTTALGRAIAHGAPVTIAAEVDWDALRARLTRGAILTELVPETPAGPADPVAAQGETDEGVPLAVVAVATRAPGEVGAPEGFDTEGFDTEGSDTDRFGLTPAEALVADPRHLLLLETAREAFERAALDPEAVRGRGIGVFLGVAHGACPTSGGVVAGQLAHRFGLVGPAITTDTERSSSLVALHLAAQSLRRGECDLALAAGADRAEGVGALLLARLPDALRDGRPVLALLRGSAISSNDRARQDVVRRVLADRARGSGPTASGIVHAVEVVLALRDGLPAEPGGDASSLTEPVEWSEGPRRAGVSSFATGGNAHVILEAPPAVEHPERGEPVDLPTHPFQRHHPTPDPETGQDPPDREPLSDRGMPPAVEIPSTAESSPPAAEPSPAAASSPVAASSLAAVPSPVAAPSPAAVPSPAAGEPPHLTGDLLRLEWRPIALAAPVTDPVVWSPCTTATTTEHAVRDLTAQALDRVRDWLADPERADARLVVLTSGAVGPGATDLAGAALWGLLRAAQSEHPGRFVLVDADDPDLTTLSAAVATGEPQLLLRDGRAHAARLTRVLATTTPAPRWRGTVLVTGGTGAVGRALAAHLARSGAEHLVLASRTGPNHPDTTALVAELTAEGAAVTIVACDVTDRPAVAALLAQLPDDQPLTAVVHAAAVPGGSATTRTAATRTAATRTAATRTPEPTTPMPLTPDPAVTGTLLLHELTHRLDLEAFVLCSSASGTVGGIGRVDQAVAGAFLDAFAARRADAGDPVVSLAWGPWDAPSGNLLPLAEADATALLDAALTAAEPVLLPTHLAPLDHTAPPLLRDLTPRRPRAAAVPGNATPAAPGAPTLPSPRHDLRRRLAEADPGALLLAEVREQVAHVLGRESVPEDLDLHELGADSPAALEIRNRLERTTELRLPATLLHDHPTPRALAEHLRARTTPDRAPASPLADLARVRAALPEVLADERARARVAAELAELSALLTPVAVPEQDPVALRLRDAGDAEVFEFIDKELGL